MSSPWKPLTGLLTTFVHLFKPHWNVQPPNCSWRRRVLCARDKPASLWNVHISPGTKAKDLVKMLAEASQRVLLSTVKGILQVPGKKHNSKKNIKKARLKCADAHGDKDLILRDLSRGLMKLKLNFCGHNDRRYIWTIKGETSKPENTILNEKYGGWRHHVVGLVCYRTDCCTWQTRCIVRKDDYGYITIIKYIIYKL